MKLTKTLQLFPHKQNSKNSTKMLSLISSLLFSLNFNSFNSLDSSNSLESSRIIKEQINSYKNLIQTEKLSFNNFIKIQKFHDNDSICNGPCERYIYNNIFNFKKEIEWNRLEEIVKELYGDSITNDPYQPQQIHLSITNNLNEMKVIWATMDNLIDPFVEYTTNMNEWIESSTSTVNAVNYTYEVPQNWYINILY